MLRPTCGQTRARPSVNCILAPTLHTHELPCSHPYSHTHQLLCDRSLRCTSCFSLTHSHLHNYRIAVSFGSRLLFSLVSPLLALSVGCDILEPSAILCVYILACLDAQQLHAGEIWVLEGDWVHLVAIFTCSPPGLSHVWSL